jgi:hypothetical protein
MGISYVREPNLRWTSIPSWEVVLLVASTKTEISRSARLRPTECVKNVPVTYHLWPPSFSATGHLKIMPSRFPADWRRQNIHSTLVTHQSCDWFICQGYFGEAELSHSDWTGSDTKVTPCDWLIQELPRSNRSVSL